LNRGLAIVAGALVLGGCGGDGAPAGPALEQTAAKLEQIESGILSVSVRMEPRNGEAFGYDLAGPVRLARDGELPVADVEYTQLANGQEDTVRLVLDEDGGGFVERDGTKTELSEAQVEELRSSGTLLGEEGLGTLGFEQWISDPQLSDGPEGTDKVTAELDVAAAMAGLAALSGVLQQDVQLSAEQRRQVADTVEESSFELLTGADDRLLRKLALSFTLGTDVPEELREAIGDDAVGASFSFDLELDEVNEPVEIG
jgi:hypothetical protein